jgi:hypothetical protein
MLLVSTETSPEFSNSQAIFDMYILLRVSRDVTQPGFDDVADIFVDD